MGQNTSSGIPRVVVTTGDRLNLTHSARGFTPTELVRFSADHANCTRLSRLGDQLHDVGKASSIVSRNSGQPARDNDTC